jgi:DUF1365 family protein
MHRRLAPAGHGFRHRIFMFALDLDELDELDRRLRLFSVGRTNLYSFRDADYLPTDEIRWNATSRRVSAAPGNADIPASPFEPSATETPRSTLKSRVTAYLAAHGVDLAGGRVELVTMPRVAGYLFNPVSFYFCHDRSGACVAVIPEVTNTFREMKPFLLGPETRRDGAFRLRVPKHFYVSPFSDVDVCFDFALRPPGAGLALQIDDFANGRRTLTSVLTGRARPLTDAALLALTLRHPLQPLHTIALIHWHALRLWWKRLPWFAKAGRPADQRDLLRPHASLTRPAAPARLRPSDAA